MSQPSLFVNALELLRVGSDGSTRPTYQKFLLSADEEKCALSLFYRNTGSSSLCRNGIRFAYTPARIDFHETNGAQHEPRS